MKFLCHMIIQVRNGGGTSCADQHSPCGSPADGLHQSGRISQREYTSFEAEKDTLDHERRTPGPATRNNDGYNTFPVDAIRAAPSKGVSVKHDSQLSVFKLVKFSYLPFC